MGQSTSTSWDNPPITDTSDLYKDAGTVDTGTSAGSPTLGGWGGIDITQDGAGAIDRYLNGGYKGEGAPSPVEGNNFFQNALTKLGSTIPAIKQGADQLATSLGQSSIEGSALQTGAIADPNMQAMIINSRAAAAKQKREQQEQVDERHRLEEPLNSTWGATLGDPESLAAAFVPELKGAKYASKLLKPTYQMIAGGLEGLLAPQGAEDSRVGNAVSQAAGNALGSYVGGIPAKLAQPLEGNRNKIGQSAVQLLHDNGVFMGTSDILGTKVSKGTKLSGMEQTLPSLTRAVARTIGEDTATITPALIKNSYEKLGANVTNWATKATVNGQYPALRDGLNAIKKELLTPGMHAPAVISTFLDPVGRSSNLPESGLLTRLMAAQQPNGNIDPKVWASIRGYVLGLSQSESSQERNLGKRMGNLMDDAYHDFADATDPKIWPNYVDAKNRYGNLRILSHSTAIDPETGYVNLSSLHTAVRGNMYNEGSQDLKNLTDAAVKVFGKNPSRSSTAQAARVGIMPLLSTIGGGAIAGPVGAVVGGVASAAKPITERAMNENAVARWLALHNGYNPTASAIARGVRGYGAGIGGNITSNAYTNNNTPAAGSPQDYASQEMTHVKDRAASAYNWMDQLAHHVLNGTKDKQ